MRKIVVRVLLAAVVFVAIVCSAHSEPVQWTVDGHTYEARPMPGGIDWQTAQSLCNSEGGYLATLTSEAENDFVFSLVSSDSSLWRWFPSDSAGLGPWIGGTQLPGSLEPDAGWQWAQTGELWEYANWAEGEPNNGGGMEEDLEDCVHFYSGSSGVLIGNHWNDAPGDSLLRGYVIEKEPASPVEDCSWGRIKALFKP